ncbi:MAG: OadG family protein [Oscillospiraceae bacterium]
MGEFFANLNWIEIWIVIFSGILIVFAVLIALTLFIALVGKINIAVSKKTDDNKNKKQLKENEKTNNIKIEKPQQKQAEKVEFNGINNDVVAAISGALSCVLDSNFKIKSIKKRNDKKQGRNPWNAAAIIENTKPF